LLEPPRCWHYLFLNLFLILLKGVKNATGLPQREAKSRKSAGG